MRRIQLGAIFAAAVACVPGAASAQGCPARATAEVIRGFGAATGAYDDGDGLIYTPSSLRILGQPVAFVLVDGQAAPSGDGVERISYRLGTLRRESGQKYPRSLRLAFARAYPASRCERDDLESLSCSDYPDNGSRAGVLTAALLYSPRVYADDVSAGAGAERVRADLAFFEAYEGEAAYLQCEYETE